jgi:pimeloyl-ACP methyl ester carboxylesterase
MAPRFLYLHGFASGPSSTKGVAFAEHHAKRGITVDRLDLRVPSFEHLRLSSMIETTRTAIGGESNAAILIGSSLGGLTAARVAERDHRVIALVLFAPAFQLINRWQQTLGPEWDDWKRTGWREVTDHTTNAPAKIDFGFTEDAAAIDRGFPKIRVPTLIFHGKNDETVPIATSREFAAKQSNIRLVELDDGHELVASLPRLLAESDTFLADWL